MFIELGVEGIFMEFSDTREYLEICQVTAYFTWGPKWICACNYHIYCQILVKFVINRPWVLRVSWKSVQWKLNLRAWMKIMKIRPVGAEFLHAVGRTDRQSWRR